LSDDCWDFKHQCRIVDRTDWLIQQFQPEPLHPWQRTEPKSFLFQIYNLAAWEPLQEKMWKLMEQKMDYDRDHKKKQTLKRSCRSKGEDKYLFLFDTIEWCWMYLRETVRRRSEKTASAGVI
jgi:hypothetical protein